MSILLKGGVVAKEIKEQIKQIVYAKGGKVGKLAIIVVGEDYASCAYAETKVKVASSLGLCAEIYHFDLTASTGEIIDLVKRLNGDPTVGGIMLQTPTSKNIDNSAIFNAICVEKDVDGTNKASFGALCMGEQCFNPATALSIMTILDYYGISVSGKNAVVVGRSQILGKPVAMLLLNANATVTICHSKTQNLPEVISRADIVVAAIGKAEFIKAEWLKKGAIVIDAGYNEGNLGDVEASAEQVAYAYTPVPGGVGPVTTAVLLKQVAEGLR